jgi:CHAT domain-containing protein/Tfp pilus assembly protein PilF
MLKRLHIPVHIAFVCKIARYADVTMAAVRSTIIAVLLIGMFLAVPHAAFAQRRDDAAALNQKIVQLYSEGRYSEAIPIAQRALAIQEKALGADHPDVATALTKLAWLYERQGRYDNAEPLYKRALAIRESALGPDDPHVAEALDSLAHIYKRQGQYNSAEPLYARALATLEKSFGPNDPWVATAMNNLADLYFDQGRYSEAESTFRQSLEIAEKSLGPNHPDVANSLANLAKVYSAEGRYADATPLLKRSLSINETELGPNDIRVAQPLRTLANLYFKQGRYADSEPLFNRALSIEEKTLGPDNPYVAESIDNLGGLYAQQGYYAQAEPLLTRALSMEEKALGPYHPAVARTLYNLAVLYQGEKRYIDSELLCKRALAILEKAFGPNHSAVVDPLNNLAELYREQGRYSDAEPLYKRALSIEEKALGPNHPTFAGLLDNLGIFYAEQGRYATAEPLYKRALSIEEKTLGPDNLDVAHSLNNLALLYENQGRYADAEPLFNRSLTIKEKLLGPDNADIASSLNNLADVYQNQGRYADALPIVRRTIAQNSARKSTAFSVIYGSQSRNLVSPIQAFDAAYTVLQQSISSSAGEAITKLAARFAAGSNELAQLVRKDQDLTAEAERLAKNIIAAVSKPPAERNAAAEEEIHRRINEIELERDELKDVFNQRFPDYVALSNPQPLSMQETQALLADDEALITFNFDAKSYVWVITKDRTEWKELAISADNVANEVKTLRNALGPDSPKSFDTDLAHRLYQQVLGPIEEIISDKARLSFVLSGALTSLPPAVLITTDPEGKELASVDWLVRKYAFTVLPSTASLRVLRGGKDVVAANKPLIGFGDPVFDRTQGAEKRKVAVLNRSLTSFYRGVTADTKSLAEALPALPETADELRAVANELGAKPEDIKLGEAATVTDVKHEPLGNYRVVYFATHALVAGEVEKFAKVKAEPALVLSMPSKPSDEDDGLLRASEVAMLKMNADFVVLSACNTAAGDQPGAEALSGLARAFFYAGARSLIVSNWEVDSESTVALMTGLFGAIKANIRLSRAEALRASELQMIDNLSKPEWSQPKFWAPFMVVGEPQKQ